MAAKPFVSALLGQLRRFKDYPNYEYERRIDAFICFFLPNVMASHYGACVSPLHLWCEFPVATQRHSHKQAKQPSHIDYAVFCRRQHKLWFIELKTARRSLKEPQIAYYNEAVCKDWEEHLDDINWISSGSSPKDRPRYAKLLNELRTIAPKHIQALMLAPEDSRDLFWRKLHKTTTNDEVIRKWSFLSLAAFASTTVAGEYSPEWDLVRACLPT